VRVNVQDRFSPRISIYSLKDLKTKEIVEGLLIKDLSFTSSEKTNDKCDFTVLNTDLRFPDDPVFDCGASLAVAWGYTGHMSPVREMVVTKYTPGWPDFKVECVGKGALMHKFQDAKTWDNVKRSDVATEIAEKWGYGEGFRDIEDTEEIYPTITKTMQTDAAFLKKMADRESKKGSKFVFYVDYTGLHFHRERLGIAPTKVYQFIPDSTDEGDLKAFPTFDAVSVQANPGKVTATGVDLTKNKKVEGTASNEDTPGRPSLGSHVITFARQGTHTIAEKQAAAETTATTGARSDEEAKKQATAAFSKSSGKASKCSVHLIGDPRLIARHIIEIQRIGKRLSGKYCITEAKHDIKGGDYTLALKLRRDANNAGADKSTSTAKVNDSTAQGGNASGKDPTPYTTKIAYSTNGTHKVQFVPGDQPKGDGSK